MKSTSILNATYAFILYLITFSTRAFRVSFPQQAVFDEYHFGEFINNYVTGKFYFDIHPPLGKLVLYFISKVIKYSGSIQFQDKYNDDFGTREYIALRIGVSLVSSLTPLIIYLLLTKYTSNLKAISVSLLVSFETSMTMEGRFILIDGILITFISIHLLVLSRSHNVLLIGFTLGLCISIKNTALCLIPFTFFMKAKKIGIMGNAVVIIESIIILFSITSFNLYILPNETNDGKMFLTPRLMDLIFRNRTVIHLFESSPLLLYQMHKLNMKNKRFHPFQSSPESWPLLTGIGINFWDEQYEEMWEIGNPFVFYIGLISVAISLYKIFGKFIKYRRIFYQEMNLIEASSIGWLLSYFPFFLVPRTTFLYHYHIPLLFAVISTVNLSDKVLLTTLAFAFAFFAYASPIIYGLPYQIKLPSLWLKGSARHRGLVEAFFGDL